MSAVEIELHVPEPVDRENGAVDACRSQFGLRKVEPGERVRIDRWAEFCERDADGEVRGGRREEITAVEGARHGLERVARIRELVSLRDAAQLLRRRVHKAVVGPDVNTNLTVLEGEGAA